MPKPFREAVGQLGLVEVLLLGGALAGGMLAASLTTRSTPKEALMAAEITDTTDTGTGPSIVFPSGVEPWMARIVKVTSKIEGGSPAAINKNSDGAGLSFGLIQWNERSGTLGPLLKAMHTKDSAAFVRIFGPSWKALLDATAVKGTHTVDGVNLWVEPWYSRFKAAGAYPAFADVQYASAARGPWMKAAIRAADALHSYDQDAPSERMIALLYDTAVSQGPGALSGAIERTLALLLQSYPNGVPDDDIPIAVFLAQIRERFRRVAPPTSETSGSWKQVGTEWHRFARSVDLYNATVNRTNKILESPDLLDTIPAFTFA